MFPGGPGQQADSSQVISSNRQAFSKVMISIEGPLSYFGISPIGGVYIGEGGAAKHLSICFGYIARLSQWGGRGYFTCTNDFYLPSRRLEGGGGSAPCGAYSFLLNLRNLALLVHHAIFAGILHYYENIRRLLEIVNASGYHSWHVIANPLIICNRFALKLFVSIFTKEFPI